jgi:hypothetical protein
MPRALLASKWPADEEALLDDGDLEALHYLQTERLRNRDSLTPDQKRLLAKHNALEARIENDPDAVANEAATELSRGITLLSKVVRSGKLRRQIRYRDGSLYSEEDRACRQFVDAFHEMARLLIVHAERGRPEMKSAVFHNANMLAGAFIRLAQASPADFISVAESSLTMPSLRARNPKYTADAAAIAKAIRLAAKHPAGNISDNRGRAGAHAHVLVANILDRIHWLRQQYAWKEETLNTLKSFHESAEEYRDVALDEYLRGTMHETHLRPMLACAALPPWEVNAEAWWHDRVLPMIKAEFSKIARHPDRNPALWQELGKAGETKRSTVKDRLRTLEKLCRNKFLQFARNARRTAARGHSN